MHCTSQTDHSSWETAASSTPPRDVAAPLLALCSIRRVGVLVQSSLCQGWLTEQGVQAARLLLDAPHRVPHYVFSHGSAIDFPALLARVLELDSLWRRVTGAACRRWPCALRYTRRAPPQSLCRCALPRSCVRFLATSCLHFHRSASQRSLGLRAK